MAAPKLSANERTLAKAVAANILATTGRMPSSRTMRDCLGCWMTIICIAFPALVVIIVLVAHAVKR
jgi:hypothetical protein